jgi:hypothetical protein
VVVKLLGLWDLFATAVLADFDEFFKMKEIVRKMQGASKVDAFLTTNNLSKWPPSLFGSLL